MAKCLPGAIRFRDYVYWLWLSSYCCYSYYVGEPIIPAAEDVNAEIGFLYAFCGIDLKCYLPIALSVAMNNSCVRLTACAKIRILDGQIYLRLIGFFNWKRIYHVFD